MREITVLSGKGGTGKTTVTAALGTLAKNTVFCDNDVDASNLHLIFQPENLEKGVYLGGWNATIHTEKCNHCGICVLHCRFDAIHTNEKGQFYINEFQCEGCRLCERICPMHAITSEQSDNNEWYISKTRFGSMVHAHMGPGEENSGKLVTLVRKKAKEQAELTEAEWIINDGPPGIGCATISSLSGVNAVLIVAEPTQSGLHDVERLVKLAQSFATPAFAIINKYDLHQGQTQLLQAYFKKEGIPVLALLPFDEAMVESMVAGQTITEFAPLSMVSLELKKAWQELDKLVPHRKK
ncbi:MAG TPA: 4Fe-4S binding protein [Marinilabiliaceae bacterium]|nr:4Fe-4S binding protein [Marinilabiliaceae bacterium]